ncbi:MAG: YeeE/YedE family protein [Bacteroidetes bacterium]|nr:YeeE/YedE family protein [Bacteroidota bacterium]
MGPLIPQGFINPDLNLLFAFVIGLGFGYVLEQGGFSNSRKLAGVFYGYDFVVLRVFFTAAITAMLGLQLFRYLGWIEFDLLYINPTYIYSIIAGGVIMGFGFILGGFCPGTSMVAAVIGKIDAMVFVLGMLIGIFIFGEAYSIFEPVYTGSFIGSPFVYESLGLSRNVFVLLLVVIALSAFIITRKIEDKVNGLPVSAGIFHPSYTGPFAMMLGLAVLFFVLPERPKARWNEVAAEELIQKMANPASYVDTDELAWKLLNPQSNDLYIVDVRPSEDFALFSLPGSINIPLAELLEPASLNSLRSAKGQIVFISNGSTDAQAAWLAAGRAGLENIRLLKGGLNGFVEDIFVNDFIAKIKDETEQFRQRFRQEARSRFSTGQAAGAKTAAPAAIPAGMKTVSGAKGGC